MAVRTGISGTFSQPFYIGGIAQTIQPQGIGSEQPVGTPDVSGHVITTPAGIAAGGSVGTPSLVPGQVTAAPDGIGSALLAGTPSALPGAVAVSPGGVASTASVGSPSLSSVITLGPDGVTAQATAGSPEVMTVVSVSPDGMIGGGLVGSPTVTSGGLPVDPVRRAWVVRRHRVRVHIGGGLYR